MRFVPLIISAIVTLTLVIILSIPLGTIPPLGSFLSPQHGFWLNAEPVNKNFSGNLQFPNLKGKTQVYFDERMVPHIFAEQEADAHFVQGYLHAKFRLWQMEFQTHAAAGRLSEILGVGADSAILNNDRNMRRLGMVFAARNSLRTIEQDADSRISLDSYTAGVNAYIEQMTNKDLPLEYRLLNYTPEKWTNLKSALFLKYMSYDLTGEENDIEFTNARTIFNSYSLEQLYPIVQDGLDPIVPTGTSFDTAGLTPKIPVTADSLYFAGKDSTSIIEQKPDKDNGSNNWAVSGAKTASGRPILCNDPHLGVNLPSLWYEIQITTPEYSVYGVSFPGAPSVVIGFNDHIAWGVTNAMRDVRDYYEIKFKEGSHTEYLFNNEYLRAEITIEEYKIKDGASMYDTVAYTLFGPVMYNNVFNGAGR
ncbi:MAG: penicillin acylase family protein, partial [Flavitalea sp.]